MLNAHVHVLVIFLIRASKLTQYLNFQDIPDELHVSYAATLLRGTAMALWRYHTQDAKNGGPPLPSTWEQFKAFLILAFQPIHPTKTARDKLSVLKQTTSVQAYLYQFQTLILDIPGFTQEESIDRFTRGLKPPIRREIELRGLTTLPEIVAQAQRLDVLSYKGILDTPNNGYQHGHSRNGKPYANGNFYSQPASFSHPTLMNPLPWNLMP